MKNRNFWIARSLMYMVFVVGIMGSALYLGAPRTVGGATCCAYGVDCPITEPPAPEMLCCFPMSGQADCAPDRPNYCKAACS